MNADPDLPERAAGPEKLPNALATAIAHMEAGRLEDAVAVLEETRAALRSPRGLGILGDVRLKQGDAVGALQAYDEAIRLAPTSREAHSKRAVALLSMGRVKDALAAAERTLLHHPHYGPAHVTRGNILRALGRWDEAVAAYDRALSRRSRVSTAQVRINRGLALLEKGRLLEALSDLRRAQQQEPARIEAYLGQANVLVRLGRDKEAVAVLDFALAVAPEDLEALALKAMILVKSRRLGDALATAELRLERDSQDPKAQVARATALRRLKRYDAALAAADAAVRLDPTDHRVHLARGLVLGEMGRYEDQLETLQTAERLGGATALLYDMRGFALSQLANSSAALAAYRRAIEIDPSDASAHTHYAYQLLAAGDFDRGWAEYEWRLKSPLYTPAVRIDLAPRWHGDSAAGRRILIVSEQGIGDCIQFLRFIPLMVKLGAGITLKVPPPLRTIIQRALPAIDVTDVLGVRGRFDYQTVLLSLPYLLKTKAERLSGSVPYLWADQALAARWHDRVGREGFRVGITWQGNPSYPGDRWRSVPLRFFEPLAAVPSVRLISLQAINGLDQLSGLPEGMVVEDFGAEIANNTNGLEHIAAIMANLDLVISSDTSVVHLAGALGVPTWLAVNSAPDWRWQQQRTDSSWYPSLRVFRQRRRGEWQDLFAEIAEALGEAAASH